MRWMFSRPWRRRFAKAAGSRVRVLVGLETVNTFHLATELELIQHVQPKEPTYVSDQQRGKGAAVSCRFWCGCGS